MIFLNYASACLLNLISIPLIFVYLSFVLWYFLKLRFGIWVFYPYLFIVHVRFVFDSIICTISIRWPRHFLQSLASTSSGLRHNVTHVPSSNHPTVTKSQKGRYASFYLSSTCKVPSRRISCRWPTSPYIYLQCHYI